MTFCHWFTAPSHKTEYGKNRFITNLIELWEVCSCVVLKYFYFIRVDRSDTLGSWNEESRNERQSVSVVSLVGFLCLKTRSDRFEVCQVKRPYGPAYGECTSGETSCHRSRGGGSCWGSGRDDDTRRSAESRVTTTKTTFDETYSWNEDWILSDLK